MCLSKWSYTKTNSQETSCLGTVCMVEGILACHILSGLTNYHNYPFLGKAVETAMFLKQIHVVFVGKYQPFNDNIC